MVDLNLAPSPTSAGVARSAVKPVLVERVDPHALDRLVLLISELVTNVVLHVGTPAELRVWVDDQLVLVKVCDGSPATPLIRLQSPDATNGRGMLLIDRLAARWGIEPAGTGKCIWFELPHHPHPEVEDDDFHFDIDSVDPI